MIFTVKTDQRHCYTGFVSNPEGKKAESIFEISDFLDQCDHIIVTEKEEKKINCGDITGCIKYEFEQENTEHSTKKWAG